MPPRPTLPMLLSLLAMAIFLVVVVVVKGGLLEDSAIKVKRQSQKVEVNLPLDNGILAKDTKLKALLETLPCIDPGATGVIPCDNNAKCCRQDSARVEGTDYCCPPGASQYYFQNNDELICACAI